MNMKFLKVVVYLVIFAAKQIQPDDANFQETANRIIKTDSKMKNLHNKVMKFTR